MDLDMRDLETRARRATDEVLRMPRDLDAGLDDLYRTRRRRATGKVVAASVAVLLAVAGVLVGHNLGHEPPPAGPTQVITISHGNPSGEGYGFGSVWVTVFASDKGSDPAHPATPQGGYVERYDPATRTLEKKITVGSDPLAAEPGFGSMWVTNGGDGTVTRIDPTTNTVLATIRVGKSPFQLAPTGGGMWVGTGNALVKIDPTTNQVVARVPIPRPPHTETATSGSAMDANAHGIWVSTSYGTVLRLRPSDGRLLKTIRVQPVPDSQPGTVLIQGNNIWVSNTPIQRTSGQGAGNDRFGAVQHLTEIGATTDKIIRRVPTAGYPVASFLPEHHTLLILGDDTQNHTSDLIRTDWPYKVVSYARPLPSDSCFGLVDTHGHTWIPCFHARSVHTLPDSEVGLPNSP